MKIRENSKKILQFLLDEAEKAGNLFRETVIKDDELAKQLGLENTKQLIICIQYLDKKGLIEATKRDNVRRLRLSVDAIDFLESELSNVFGPK